MVTTTLPGGLAAFGSAVNITVLARNAYGTVSAVAATATVVVAWPPFENDVEVIGAADTATAQAMKARACVRAACVRALCPRVHFVRVHCVRRKS